MMTFNRQVVSFQNLSKTIRISLFLAIAIFYIYCAYKSSGYLQEDEHYQIIEFANYKLGTVPANRLAWEFAAKIRSGIQPLICYIIISMTKLLGVTNGYDITFIIRTLTGLFSIYVIRSFILAYRKYVTNSLKDLFLITSFLLWFLPYINIRFSSENLSGLMLIFSLTLLEKSNLLKNKSISILTGTVLGLAILFRYQSCLFVLGIFLWLLLIKRAKYTRFLNPLLGITVILLLGILIDFWLYGEWTLTAINYFNINILKNVASSFGTEPFYQYLLYVLRAPGPLGIFIFISFVLMISYYPRNIIVWVCMPFLLVHSIIPHKELRFLFPLANLCPLILIIGLQKSLSILRKRSKPAFKLVQVRGVFLLTLFVIINLLGLYAISSTSAEGGKFSVAEYLHRHYVQNHLGITIVGDSSPFIDWGTIQNSYYSSTGYKIKRLVNVWQKEIIQKKNDPNDFKNILIIKANEIAGPKEIAHLKSIGWIKKYQCLPNFTYYLYNFYNRDLKDNQVFIFEKND